jgi:hypothetical protein
MRNQFLQKPQKIRLIAMSLKSSRSGVAKMIGVACNLWHPNATFHAAQVKKCIAACSFEKLFVG